MILHGISIVRDMIQGEEVRDDAAMGGNMAYDGMCVHQ